MCVCTCVCPFPRETLRLIRRGRCVASTERKWRRWKNGLDSTESPGKSENGEDTEERRRRRKKRIEKREKEGEIGGRQLRTEVVTLRRKEREKKIRTFVAPSTVILL